MGLAKGFLEDMADVEVTEREVWLVRNDRVERATERTIKVPTHMVQRIWFDHQGDQLASYPPLDSVAYPDEAAAQQQLRKSLVRRIAGIHETIEEHVRDIEEDAQDLRRLEMIKCACGDPRCRNCLGFEGTRRRLWIIGDDEVSVYLDPNSIAQLIGELRKALAMTKG